MLGLGRAEPFPRDFSGCFCTTSCHPVLCTSAPSWEVAARSNLSGKWLFLEFHRREELSGAWNGIGASYGETSAGKRHKSPRKWEPWRALGEREAKAQIQVRYQGKDLPSCRQAGNRHRGREGRARALQTDVCLCKRPRAAGEGTGSVAPAPLLGDWDAQNSPASAFAHPCACPAVNTRFGSGTKASNTYCFCCVLSSISRLVEHCKTASGYEKDYTNEAVVRL